MIMMHIDPLMPDLESQVDDTVGSSLSFLIPKPASVRSQEDKLSSTSHSQADDANSINASSECQANDVEDNPENEYGDGAALDESEHECSEAGKKSGSGFQQSYSQQTKNKTTKSPEGEYGELEETVPFPDRPVIEESSYNLRTRRAVDYTALVIPAHSSSRGNLNLRYCNG
jgi:hypothetical protein